MKRLRLFLFIGGFTLLSTLAAEDAPSARDAARITALVEQLGDDRFEQREAAHKALQALGEKALTALADAVVDHADLEVRRRARRLILEIMPRERKSKSIGLQLVGIDAGEFHMGSSLGETGRKPDETRHLVKLTRPFFLGAYEVTQGEYQDVMKVNPSYFCSGGGGKLKVHGLDTTRFPVERVSWFDALEFCNRLSQQDGLPPYYRLENISRTGHSISAARVAIRGGNGYRLPTEAEWEYACRAGTDLAFHFGREIRRGEANARAVMVSSGGYGLAPKWRDLDQTAKVGSYPRNRWGLYDMHGNVAEFCWDWYDRAYYTTSPQVNPQGSAAGNHRVVRGGSWMVPEGSCRSASRYWFVPGEGTYHIGFRVARNP